jgi:hypothetical protein
MKVPEPDGRMRLRVMVHEQHVRHDQREGAPPARVLIPADPLAHTWVSSPHFNGYGTLWSNRADLLRLGALFRLAAVSPHSVVHIPVPETEPIEPVAHWSPTQKPVSLVIARDSAGLRPSQWTQIRRRLGQGTPRSMRAPAPRPDGSGGGGGGSGYPPVAPLRLTEHAEALIVTGPAATLFQAGDRLTDAGHYVATSPRVHKYGEDLLTTLTNMIADTERGSGNPRERRFEWDVYVHEPIFHKARWQARPPAVPGDQPSSCSKPRASRPRLSRTRW